MTDAQAESILTGLCAAFTKRLTDEERLVWLAEIAPLDAQAAAAAAISYGRQGERFPSLPEFRRAVRTRIATHDADTDLTGSTPRRRPPDWVFRWVAARFLHNRFDKQQDMRRFPQQQDFASPDTPLMPETEWLEEAQQISEAETWAAVQHFGEP